MSQSVLYKFSTTEGDALKILIDYIKKNRSSYDRLEMQYTELSPHLIDRIANLANGYKIIHDPINKIVLLVDETPPPPNYWWFGIVAIILLLVYEQFSSYWS